VLLNFGLGGRGGAHPSQYAFGFALSFKLLALSYQLPLLSAFSF
jgi:hypothetical protein